MRLFICIDLGKDQLDIVEMLKKRLEGESIKGRFAKPEHMHLTLNFIGEIEDEKLRDVIEVMDRVYFSGFDIHMSGLGWFHKRSGKIYWVLQKENSRCITWSFPVRRNIEHNPMIGLCGVCGL